MSESLVEPWDIEAGRIIFQPKTGEYFIEAPVGSAALVIQPLLAQAAHLGLELMDEDEAEPELTHDGQLRIRLVEAA